MRWGRRERLRVWADQVWKVGGKLDVVAVVVVVVVAVAVAVWRLVRVRKGPQ